MTLLADDPQTGAAERSPGAPTSPPTPPPGGAGPVIDPDPSKGWIKRLWPIVRQHQWVFVVSIVASIVTSLLQVAVPSVLSGAIDNALPSPTGGAPTSTLEPYVLIIAGMAVARFALGYVSRYGLMHVAYSIEYDLRTILYRHLTRLSFSFYDRAQTGDLVSRANSDIRAVQMYLAFVPNISVQGLTFLVAIVIMLNIHVGLTLAAVVGLPAVYWVGMHLRHLMFPVNYLVQARVATVATDVEENVTGVRVIKSFAGERKQIAKLATDAQRLRWAGFLNVDIRAKWLSLMENTPKIGQALIVLYGGWLAIEGQITVGQLAQFNIYVVMLQAPFRMVGMLMSMSQQSAASARRIFEILDEDPDIVDQPGAVVLENPQGDVEFRDVTFAYPSRRSVEGEQAVLHHLDLHLAPGETVALVGRTGSGKSTVARLLTRFYDIEGGALLIDGVDVRNIQIRSLRDAVGVVQDEPFLFSDSLGDNIAYARPDASFETIVEAAKAAGAHEFIERLPAGYDTVVGERGYTLSGGQRQRIAIARTLVQNPRILLLDDATSAIDVHREAEIHDALRTLMTGRTTLIIAHRLSTISLADRVLLLEGGRIVADGTHNRLMATEPRYAAVLAAAESDDDADDTPPPLPGPPGMGMRPGGPPGMGGGFGGPPPGGPGGFGMGPDSNGGF